MDGHLDHKEMEKRARSALRDIQIEKSQNKSQMVRKLKADIGRARAKGATWGQIVTALRSSGLDLQSAQIRKVFSEGLPKAEKPAPISAPAVAAPAVAKIAENPSPTPVLQSGKVAIAPLPASI